MTATDRTPPHDLEAERAVIAAALQIKGALAACSQIITGQDFYQPTHEDIWNTCLRLAEDRAPVDGITVNAALQLAGNVHAVKALISVTGAELPGKEPTYHARIVAERARFRQLINHGQYLIQRGYSPAGASAEDVIAEAADKARDLRDSGVMADDDVTAITIDELLQMSVSYDWVIPGLLESGDRLMLTGSEGLGKSYISRQIGICAAAGLHPFTFRPVPPKKVLIVDAENSLKINIRAYSWLRNACRSYGLDPGPRLLLESYPFGMNVMDPREGNKLIRLVEAQRPDLVIIGPAYKIHELDDEKAADALRIQKYLDRVRAVCNSALMMEIHSPHDRTGSMRPAGSSVWRRWPEFGYGITLTTDPEIDEETAVRDRIVDMKPWRGPRDEREWPFRLRQGKVFPWIPANHEERPVQGADEWARQPLPEGA